MSDKVKTVLGNRVILVNPPESSTRIGGVYIPGSQTNIGIVKHISPEAQDTLKIGDKVLYGQDFLKMKVENEDSLIMPASNIIAVLEG